MIFGIEFHELLLFLKQAGLATAGASSFWGISSLLITKINGRHREFANLVSRRLVYVFFPAIFIYVLAWSLLGVILCVLCADAHEGITRPELLSEIIQTMTRQYAAFALLAFLSASGILFFTFRREVFVNNLKWFYGVSFFMITFLMLYPWQIYEPLRITVASSFHSWHSIFTFGSVIVVDFLYTTMRQVSISSMVSLFSWITKGIWVGLGLDFVSSGLVFDIGYSLSDKFLFNQIVIGILIINGVILAGPIFRKVVSSVRGNRKEKFGSNLYTITGVSGSISLASWITITAIDGFKTLSLSFFELLAFYAGFIVLIFLAHSLFDRFMMAKLVPH